MPQTKRTLLEAIHQQNIQILSNQEIILSTAASTLKTITDGFTQLGSDVKQIVTDLAVVQKIVSDLRNQPTETPLTVADLLPLADAISNLHSSLTAADGNIQGIINPAPPTAAGTTLEGAVVGANNADAPTTGEVVTAAAATQGPTGDQSTTSILDATAPPPPVPTVDQSTTSILD
jgi:hypothetical protein